jgi:hypothetical protein
MPQSYFRPYNTGSQGDTLLPPEEPCSSSGLTVVTRSPDTNNVAGSTVGTALPKFAIRGMLKTFGLHGVVLDVDSVSEQLFRLRSLVLTETQTPRTLKMMWLGRSSEVECAFSVLQALGSTPSSRGNE